MHFLDRLLNYYQLSKEEYASLIKDVSIDDLPSLEQFADLNKIVQTILDTIASNGKIVIYGDYDADGILATSILVDTFKKMNVEVGYYIPNRYQDGYGLTLEKVSQFADKDYALIITVDNGISAFEAIEYAYDKGLKVIITDHHEIKETLPPNEGILHPFLMEQPHSLCGAFMALILAKALLGSYDMYHLSLASIATIADMMPLSGYNRTIVRLGINQINKQTYPSFNLLIKQYPIDERNIGMFLTPIINALGRLSEDHLINRIVKYFTSRDYMEQVSIHNWLIKINDQRKSLVSEAILRLPEVTPDHKAIVYLSNELEGLLGLLANRLLNEYQRPSFVFAPTSKDPSLLVGSARVTKGYDLLALLEKLQPYLIAGGGHAQAMGLTINVANFDKVKQIIYDYFKENAIKVEPIKAIIVSKEEINMTNYQFVKNLSPFGQAHLAPKFELENVETNSLSFTKKGDLLSTRLNHHSRLFSFDIKKEMITNNQLVNLIGTWHIDIYNQQAQLIFYIDSFIDKIHH